MSNLNIKQNSEIYKLIDTYKSIFANDKYDIGTADKYEARIYLLVDRRPYRCTQRKQRNK